MSSPVADPQVAAAFAALDADLDGLIARGLTPVDVTDAYGLQRRLEAISHRVASLQVGLLSEVQCQGLHAVDGHASAKVAARFAGNLSNHEANRRDRMARMVRSMPLTAAAFGAGRIGRCQVERMAQTHRNPRVRGAFEALDADLVIVAMRLPYPEFDARLTEWERLEDQDGAERRAERSHRTRDCNLRRNLDGSVRADGGWGEIQGEEMIAIHERQVQLEWEADWAEARERLGDAATTADLQRTDRQRRADAAHAIFRRADAALVEATSCSPILLDVVMDLETAERELRRMCGDDPGRDDRADTLFHDLAEDLEGPDASEPSVASDDTAPPLGRRLPFRCATRDGHALHPAQVMAAALTGHVRRVVMGSDRVVLEMGRKRRLFDGPRRDAVLHTNETCGWTGCQVPASQCHADHMIPFSGPGQGRTDPDNGAPLCGRHNRIKEHGFTVTRDGRGRIHVFRPDGTEIS